jgi:hypothetical protein
MFFAGCWMSDADANIFISANLQTASLLTLSTGYTAS